ncbi:unnamed protein product [Malus baccata var. baccata]
MAMQRLFSKLRSFAVRSAQTLPSSLSSPALLRSCPPLLYHPLPFASIRNKWTVRSLFIAHSPIQSLPPALTALHSSAFPFSVSWSYKSRFRTMNDGTIRRWRAGKRHNAHLKSKISKRRLRLPALVHPAYATVMKKLNFCG